MIATRHTLHIGAMATGAKHAIYVAPREDLQPPVCIYPLIYTPLPNSRWHHTALRYVQRVQLGAYIWRWGLNWVKMGSKWANFACLCTPIGVGSVLEKRVFDVFFTHFCSEKGPFSRHFGIFHGPKCITTGLKTG